MYTYVDTVILGIMRTDAETGWYAASYRVYEGLTYAPSILAAVLTPRLSYLFLRDEQGRRPIFGGAEKFQTDPHFRDHILFYEYFHGDNGAGLGASHQTGWTALVAKLLQQSGE
jgi:hypothetical protein